MVPADFWTDADELVRTHRVVVDRPRNTPHPKATQHIYPLDYGYLEGTSSGDGAGIDVWIGTAARPAHRGPHLHHRFAKT